MAQNDMLKRYLEAGLAFTKMTQERAEAIVRVSEEAMVRAMGLLLTRMKLLVEPTGTLAAAAVLDGLIPEDARRVGVILSGGNVDPETLARLLGKRHEENP